MKEFSAHQLKYYLSLKNKLNPLCTRTPNSVDYWHPSDTEERFIDNVKKYSNSVHIKNYLKVPIKYEYNNYGFRTPDDFNLKNIGNIFLGCSHTFGIGHHLENTWSYKLSQKIGGKFYNISEPGSGIMTQYRYLKYFADKITFKNVFHFLPEECWARYEYYLDGNFDFLHSAPESLHVTKYGNFMLDVLYNENQYMHNVFVHIDAIKNICKEYGSNYYIITNSHMTKIDAYSKSLTPARDIEHYYVEDHENIYQQFYKKYINKNTSNTNRTII